MYNYIVYLHFYTYMYLSALAKVQYFFWYFDVSFRQSLANLSLSFSHTPQQTVFLSLSLTHSGNLSLSRTHTRPISFSFTHTHPLIKTKPSHHLYFSLSLLLTQFAQCPSLTYLHLSTRHLISGASHRQIKCISRQ